MLKVFMILSTIVSGQPNTRMYEMKDAAACAAAVKDSLARAPTPDRDHSYGAGCIIVQEDGA